MDSHVGLECFPNQTEIRIFKFGNLDCWRVGTVINILDDLSFYCYKSTVPVVQQGKRPFDSEQRAFGWRQFSPSHPRTGLLVWMSSFAKWQIRALR